MPVFKKLAYFKSKDMEFLFSGAMILQGLFWIFLIVAFIYFLVKRLEDKDKETFEDRDF